MNTFSGKKGKGKKGGGPEGNLTDFSGSLLSTDPDDLPDFTKMTEAEKKAYFAAKVCVNYVHNTYGYINH